MKITNLLISSLLSFSLIGQACLPAFAQEANNNSEEEIEEISDEETNVEETTEPVEEAETLVEEETEEIVVENESGKCGDTVSYNLQNKVLTISGSGAMDNYSNFSETPWYGKVTTLYIEEGITSVGKYCFSSIENVYLPNSLATIKHNGFCDCTNIYVDSVETLLNIYCESGNAARYNNYPSSLKNRPILYIDGEYISALEIPEGTTHIPSYAFANFDNINTVILPNSLVSIENSAFEKSGISRISIPNSVTSIGNSAFFFTYSLEYVYLPNNLKTISYSLFRCSALEYISIPSSVTEIKGLAFSKCENLRFLEIPASITTIETDSGYLPTKDSPNLDTIFYHGSEEQWKNIKAGFNTYKTMYPNIMGRFSYTRYDYVFYGIKDSVLTICGEGGMKELYDQETPWSSSSSTIKEIQLLGNVVSISPGVFKNMTKLERAYLGENLTSIGDEAFYGCTKLHTVVLPETITDYGNSIFKGCKALTNIILPSTIPGITDQMFAQCSALESITIPEGATTIGTEAFSGCTSLKTVNLPSTMTSIADGAFKNCTCISAVKYPGNLYGWSNIQKGSDNEAIMKSSNNYSWYDSPVSLIGYKAYVGTSIRVDFYLDTSSPESTTVNFTYPNGTPYRAWGYDSTTTLDGKTYYIYRCEIPAKDMTGTITADVYYGQSTHKGRYTFTLSEYLEYIIQNADSMYSYSSYYRNVAKALLTYGNYTQTYFNYKTNYLPKAYNALKDVDLSSYQYSLSDNNTKLDFVGARLVLKSNVQLKLYFKGTGDIYVDGVKQITNIEDGYITILLNNTNWRKIYQITSGNNFTLRYGVYSYGYQALKGSNTKLKNMIKAMCNLNSAVGVG